MSGEDIEHTMAAEIHRQRARLAELEAELAELEARCTEYRTEMLRLGKYEPKTGVRGWSDRALRAEARLAAVIALCDGARYGYSDDAIFDGVPMSERDVCGAATGNTNDQT